MEKHDYVKESITDIGTKKVSITTLNEKLKKHGKLISKGMPYKEYKEVMKLMYRN